MKTVDLAIVETGNGGDLVKTGNDLSFVFSIQSMIYLSLFGGNVEGDTTTKSNEEEQSFDYWANDLLMKTEPSQQFNSQTERTLSKVAFNSDGRVKILNAVKNDLKYFSSDLGVELKIEVRIIDYKEVQIDIFVKETEERIVTINYKKQSDGDFFLFDFNDDFYL
jgi:hypothetical protein